MSAAGIFPFAPEKLAALTAFSRSVNALGAPPPIAVPAAVDERGYIWTPNPADAGEAIGSYVHAGVRLGWIDAPELGGVILIQWGGQGAEPGFEEEGITTFMTRDGLGRYIADLQAILAAAGAA
ncbi:MAG: hypothetical protein ACTHM0_13550 [Sphingomonas sp.]